MKNNRPLKHRMLALSQFAISILIAGQGIMSSVAMAGDDASVYFLMKNRWNNAYLFDAGNDLQYKAGDPGSDTAFQWTVVPRGGQYFDIKNRKTGDLINIEHLQDSVQSDKSCPVGGDSSKWAFEPNQEGYVRLRNGWHFSDYLHIEQLKGYVQHGMMYPIWESAQWRILVVKDGAPNQPNLEKNASPAPQSIPNQPTNVSQPSNAPPPNTINNYGIEPVNSINVQSYSAVGDGRTDNQSALQRAFDTAKAQGKVVWIPTGTYNHSGVLTIDGIKVQGAGSSTILNATNPEQSAIKLTGNNSSIAALKTTVVAPNRSSMPDPAAVLIQNATNATVSNLTIQGAASNGVRIDNSSGSQVYSNLVLGTNADGIAIMNGSVGNTVRNNVVYQAGDDSYSDDSYRGDHRQDSNNSFLGNLSLDNAYGRGITLAGSKNAIVKFNVISGSRWIGIFADSDPNSGTMDSSGHTILDNTVINNPNGAPVQATGPGMSVGGTITNAPLPSLSTFLGWIPGNLPDRYSFNPSYRPGTGSGANNSGGNRT